MHPEAGNVGLVCPGCAAKRIPGAYTHVELEQFIGTYVKLAFPVRTWEGAPTTESMWVYVTEIVIIEDPDPSQRVELAGNVRNTPVYDTKEYQYDACVGFGRQEILDWTQKEQGTTPDRG